ncbi:MAG: PH domain-containing protein [Pseudomonadales bacterium]|jgi:putative membrane protein|nr:PH domain-containing protein [Pseudomonadales bacterium]
MARNEVLCEGEIDRAVKRYWLTNGTIVCVLTGVLIPLIPIYLIVGSLLIDRWLANLRCTLTTRHLEIRKGVLNRVESTIPLARITDLQLYQGPLMRLFGLQGFRVETAGQSSGATGYLVNIVGLKAAADFREAVLDQRDRLEAQAPANAPEDGSQQDMMSLGREIRDALLRIEAGLTRRD